MPLTDLDRRLNRRVIQSWPTISLFHPILDTRISAFVLWTLSVTPWVPPPLDSEISKTGELWLISSMGNNKRIAFFSFFFFRKKINILKIFWYIENKYIYIFWGDFFFNFKIFWYFWFFFNFYFLNLFKVTKITTKSYQGYYWTPKMA